jgi:hypothetical protein
METLLMETLLMETLLMENSGKPPDRLDLEESRWMPCTRPSRAIHLVLRSPAAA